MLKIPKGCLCNFWAAPVQDDKQYYSYNNKRCGNQLSLCGMEAEDVIFSIYPDPLDKEPLQAIYY